MHIYFHNRTYTQLAQQSSPTLSQESETSKGTEKISSNDSDSDKNKQKISKEPGAEKKEKEETKYLEDADDVDNDTTMTVKKISKQKINIVKPISEEKKIDDDDDDDDNNNDNNNRLKLHDQYLVLDAGGLTQSSS